MNSFLARFAGGQDQNRSNKSSKRPARRGLQLERLEQRNLMAIDVYYDDGYRDDEYVHPELQGIHILGTSGADKAYVTEKNGIIAVKTIDPAGQVKKYSIESFHSPHIFFHGFGGSDTFSSQSWAKTYAWGGPGNDQMFGGRGVMYMYGEGGEDTLDGTAGTYAELYGGDNKDTLVGTEYRDVLRGEQGDDTLIGLGGDDELYGDRGDDGLLGGEGSDLLDGSHGNDDLQGNGGDDTLVGGPVISYSTADEDFLSGGLGTDFLYGGFGRDYLDGNDRYNGFHHDGSWDFLQGDLGPDSFVNPYTYSAENGGFLPEDAIYDFSTSDAVIYELPGIFFESIEGTSFTEQRKLALKGLSQGMSNSAGEGFAEPELDENWVEEVNLLAANDQALLSVLAEEAPSLLDSLASEFSEESLDWLLPISALDEPEPGFASHLEEPLDANDPLLADQFTDDEFSALEIAAVEGMFDEEEPASDFGEPITIAEVYVYPSLSSSWSSRFASSFVR